MKPARTVYFDLETGGVEPHYPNIQLAALVIDEPSWTEVAHFERKIAFDPKACDPKALEINRWSEDAWRDAVPPATVAMQFRAFLNEHRSLELISTRTGKPYGVAKLAGHNAATFDGPRLRDFFKHHDLFLPADPRVRDTLQLALWHFDLTGEVPPKDFKLATLCEHFGIPVSGTHEALADVRLTVQLARVLYEQRVVRAA